MQIDVLNIGPWPSDDQRALAIGPLSIARDMATTLNQSAQGNFPPLLPMCFPGANTSVGCPQGIGACAAGYADSAGKACLHISRTPGAH
jgi:hypothetical protein